MKIRQLTIKWKASHPQKFKMIAISLNIKIKLLKISINIREIVKLVASIKIRIIAIGNMTYSNLLWDYRTPKQDCLNNLKN